MFSDVKENFCCCQIINISFDCSELDFLLVVKNKINMLFGSKIKTVVTHDQVIEQKTIDWNIFNDYWTKYAYK